MNTENLRLKNRIIISILDLMLNTIKTKSCLIARTSRRASSSLFTLIQFQQSALLLGRIILTVLRRIVLAILLGIILTLLGIVLSALRSIVLAVLRGIILSVLSVLDLFIERSVNDVDEQTDQQREADDEKNVDDGEQNADIGDPGEQTEHELSNKVEYKNKDIGEEHLALIAFCHRRRYFLAVGDACLRLIHDDVRDERVLIASDDVEDRAYYGDE